MPFCAVRAQDTPVNPNNNNLAALATFGPDGANIGSSSIVVNPPSNVQGAIHLFPSWRNTGVFTVTGLNKKLLIRNINYNLRRQVFESKMGRDSIFTFSLDNVEELLINQREFRSLFVPGERGYRLFEVIFEADSFAILKSHYLTVNEGSDNPMVNRPSRYVQSQDYYIKRGNSYKPFRMRKKDVLRAAADQAGAVEDFADEHDLSFKKDQDVKRMLTEIINKTKE